MQTRIIECIVNLNVRGEIIAQECLAFLVALRPELQLELSVINFFGCHGGCLNPSACTSQQHCLWQAVVAIIILGLRAPGSGSEFNVKMNSFSGSRVFGFLDWSFAMLGFLSTFLPTAALATGGLFLILVGVFFGIAFAFLFFFTTSSRSVSAAAPPVELHPQKF